MLMLTAWLVFGVRFVSAIPYRSYGPVGPCLEINVGHLQHIFQGQPDEFGN